MIRELVSRISRTIIERRASVRRKYQVPVRVCFAPATSKAGLPAPCTEAFLSGETIDISETGIGFTVASIRIKENYLVGQERPLNVELDLAGRKVRMKVLGVRYERVGIDISTERYFIGASIIEMSDEDRGTYEHFLNNGRKLMKNYDPVMESIG